MYSAVEVGVVPEVQKMPGLQRELKKKARELSVMNRAPSTALMAAMQHIEKGVASPCAQDEDWTCDCGFVNFASKSKRLFCAKCNALRRPLPTRRSYLLTGQRGIGKSMELARVVQWARKRGWVALVVPSAWHYVNMGDWVSPSDRYPGKFEQPHGAKDVLSWTLSGNARSSLEAVKIMQPQARERWGAETLRDLLEAACEDDNFDEASTAVSDAFEALAVTDAVPVLLAVDEISSWFAVHVDHYFKQKRLLPTDVVGVDRMLSPLLDAEFRFERGLALYADSGSRQIKLAARFRQILSHMPHEIKCLPLDDLEFRAAIDYYVDFMHVGRPLDDRAVNTLKMTTQRNPRALYDRMLIAAFDLYDDLRLLEYDADTSLQEAPANSSSRARTGN